MIPTEILARGERSLPSAGTTLPFRPALSSSPTGFTASDLAEKVRAISGETDSEYGVRRAAYDIKKLRGKGMAQKNEASRRFSKGSEP